MQTVNPNPRIEAPPDPDTPCYSRGRNLRVDDIELLSGRPIIRKEEWPGQIWGHQHVQPGYAGNVMAIVSLSFKEGHSDAKI